MEENQIQRETIKLSQAQIGNCYRVTAIRASGAIRQRMLDMGIVPGVHITVMRFAPLGDPIEIRINRFFMSLRREEAQYIDVMPVKIYPHQRQRRFRRFFHGR